MATNSNDCQKVPTKRRNRTLTTALKKGLWPTNGLKDVTRVMNQRHKSVPREDLFWLERKLPHEGVPQNSNLSTRCSSTAFAVKTNRFWGEPFSMFLLLLDNPPKKPEGGGTRALSSFIPTFPAWIYGGGPPARPRPQAASRRRRRLGPPAPMTSSGRLGLAPQPFNGSARAAAAALAPRGERRPCDGGNGLALNPSTAAMQRTDGSAPALG